MIQARIVCKVTRETKRRKLEEPNDQWLQGKKNKDQRNVIKEIVFQKLLLREGFKRL